MNTRRLQTASALLLCLGLVACSKSSKPASTPAAKETTPETTSPAPVTVEETPTPASGTTEGSTTTTTPAEEKPAPLSDEQIVMITELANSAEIEQGKFAQGYAKNSDVKKFAKMMVEDHTKAKDKQAKLVSKFKLTPADSPVSKELKSGAASTLSTLKAAPADDFDRTYIEQQVKQHRELLDVIDKQLIPSASNPELITQLAEVRPMVAHHLEKAEALQEKLMSTPAKK